MRSHGRFPRRTRMACLSPVMFVTCAFTMAGCGSGNESPTTPAPVPTPLQTACSTALRACGSASPPCVSLRYTTASACRDSACLQGIATLLRNNGVTVNSIPFWLPEWELPANGYLYPGCVGTRSDLGGTAQEADCLVKLLNASFTSANYTADSTNCRADGFPHMIIAR